MIKSELVTRVSDRNHHLNRGDIEKVVNAVLRVIEQALQRGDRVELRRFGAFTVKKRIPRPGRNPRTAVAVAVPERFVPFFRSAKEMRQRLNGGTPPSAKNETRRPLIGHRAASPSTRSAPASS